MWSTPAFLEAVGWESFEENGSILWERRNRNSPLTKSYEFQPIHFTLNEKGAGTWKKAKPGEQTTMRIFCRLDEKAYNEDMRTFLKQQFQKAKIN